MKLPLDIRPKWLNVIRRMQSKSCNQAGCAVVSISVFVDKSGDPVAWTEPKMVKVEPKEGWKELARLLTD